MAVDVLARSAAQAEVGHRATGTRWSRIPVHAAEDACEAFQAEDTRAARFGRFYDQTSPLAFSLALRITGDTAAAGMVCESAYLRAWRDGDQSPFRERETVLLERVRSSALETLRESALSAPRPPKPNSNAHKRIWVRTYLHSLESNCRTTIELACYRGMNAPEIGALTGQPVAAVRKALRDGMLQLAANLRATGRIAR